MVFKCIQYYDFGLLVGSPTFWIYFHCFSWPGAYYNQVISWVDEIHYSFNILMFVIAHKIMDDWNYINSKVYRAIFGGHIFAGYQSL